MGVNKVWEWEEAMERLGNFLEWIRGKWTLGLLNLHLLSRRTLVTCPFWGYLCRLWLSRIWVKAVDSKSHLWDHLIPKLPSGPTLTVLCVLFCFCFFFLKTLKWNTWVMNFCNFFLAVLGLRCCAQAFSSCSTWVAHCGGFSCCRAQALGTWASIVVALGL